MINMNLPEGWPTDEMIEEGHAAYWHWMNDNADSREKLASAFRAMIAAAPTPPAPEDEPVAWINPTANPYAPLDMHFQFQDPHDAKWTPLYTRPDDKLRKLAQEYIEYMYPGADVDRSSAQIMSFLYYYGKNLRAALEQK